MTVEAAVRVEQAIYGEVRSGHALREASGDARLAAELAPRLDLPDTAPSGADWSPFVSGFPFRDRYVLARTFKDANAGRSGMVFAHALVMPLDELIAIEELAPFLAQLVTAPKAPKVLSDLEISVTAATHVASPDLAAAASLLVQRASGPVVRLGHEGFEGLVTGLWRGLTPGMRRTFAFRLSFGPNDLAETPMPALICTPPTLLGRWQGYRVIDVSETPAASLAADLLCRAPGGDALGVFRNLIGVEPVSFAELSLLAEAYRLAFVEVESFANLVAAIRLVGRLSPAALSGTEGKSSLLDRAILHLEGAKASEVLLLRNLDLSAFPAPQRFWEALQHWGARNAYSVSEDIQFQALFSALATPGEAIDVWRTAVNEGMFAAARLRKPPIAAAFWRYAREGQSNLSVLWQAMRLRPEQEDDFVAAVPRELPGAEAVAIVELAASAGLAKLHGVAASLAFKPAAAAARQLAFESGPKVEGLRLALRAAKPAELVAVAITLKDQRIISIAAEAASKSPNLLRALDYTDTTAQALWSETLSKNPAAWNAPANPKEAFHHVLDGVLASEPVALTLVNQLSPTSLANVGRYTRRPELWGKLSNPALGRMLAATANAWISEAPTSEPSLEPDLEAAVLIAQPLDALLSRLAHENAGAAVEAFAALPNFPEMRFRAWLRSALTTGRFLAMTEAEALGRLIEIRGWRASAEDLLASLRQGRGDVRPALRSCLALIGFLDRWFLDLSPISVDEKWETLADTASDLFSSGPDENGLWERAGGHNADLMTYGNGRSRWREALQRIRLGARGPRVEKLLREMLKDYPGNSALGFLVKDEEFDGRR